VEAPLLCPLDEVRIRRHLCTHHTEERGYCAVTVTLELLLVSIREILVEEVEVVDVIRRERNLVCARLELEPRGYLY
jgi:hypothetical protein